MRIILAGATGLIGGSLVSKLGGQDVTLVGRRTTNLEAKQLVGAVDEWPALIGRGAYDVAINCLGTTIKVAGSQQAFAAVDRDAVIAVAKAAKEAGARQFLMVSSVGASASTSNFYLRTKGEAEEGVKALGFDRVDICRPGLLRGERGGASRPGERAMIALSPITDLLTPSVFDQYRSIAAYDVAKAIAALIGQAEPGVHIHHNRDMLREAARFG